MRYLIPLLCLASPALAHPAALPHTHSTSWAVPAALLLIGIAAVAARRQAVLARARK